MTQKKAKLGQRSGPVKEVVASDILETFREDQIFEPF
jgi:hypothetical protein